MQKILYIIALGLFFGGMQSGNFIAFIMAALAAYVLIEAAESMTIEEKEDWQWNIKNWKS